MRASILFLLFIYITVAIAGGYAGCLEKIWLFKAYEIDGLNPAAQHKIGFKCQDWDRASRACNNNNWVQCAGTATGGRCTYGEFIDFIDEVGNALDGAVPPTGDLDTVETAKRCMTKFGGKPPGAPPYHAMQNTHEWNDFINKVSEPVDNTWKADLHTTSNVRLWDQFDDIRNQIVLARTGDHGRWLTKEALKKVVPKTGITLNLCTLARIL